LLDSDRWLRLANAGARPQRLVWASTGTKDPAASDILYIRALAAPFTVNTIPDKTLLAFADHGSESAQLQLLLSRLLADELTTWLEWGPASDHTGMRVTSLMAFPSTVHARFDVWLPDIHGEF
jgi:Transaldolase/Fructose-6-phosphate aldolase